MKTGKTRLFWAVGLILLVAGAWVAAQDSGPRGDESKTHFDLAKAALKTGQYAEAAAEADKLLALDGNDLRAKYLKQEADYYQNGVTPPPVPGEVVKPPEAETATAAASATSAVAVPEQTPPPVAAKPMSKDEVDKLYKTFNKNMNEFQNTIQPLLIAKCGNDNCHGSSDRGGAFHLKKTALQDRTTIAENFKAMDAYVDADAPAQSKLLAISLAKNDVHKSDKAPIFATEADPAYKVLKAFLLKLPSGADQRWGTGR